MGQRRRISKGHAIPQPHSQKNGELGSNGHRTSKSPQRDATTATRRIWKPVKHRSEHCRWRKHNFRSSTSCLCCGTSSTKRLQFRFDTAGDCEQGSMFVWGILTLNKFWMFCSPLTAIEDSALRPGGHLNTSHQYFSSCTTHRLQNLVLLLFLLVRGFTVSHFGWKQSCPSRAEKLIIVAAHFSQIVIHSPNTNGTLSRYPHHVPLIVLCLSLCTRKMISSGSFVDTHPFTPEARVSRRTTAQAAAEDPPLLLVHGDGAACRRGTEFSGRDKPLN